MPTNFWDFLQVPSVLFTPSHLVSLFTLGLPSALVLDCGYTETLVLPVSFLFETLTAQILHLNGIKLILYVRSNNLGSPTEKQ